LLDRTGFMRCSCASCGYWACCSWCLLGWLSGRCHPECSALPVYRLRWAHRLCIRVCCRTRVVGGWRPCGGQRRQLQVALAIEPLCDGLDIGSDKFDGVVFFLCTDHAGFNRRTKKICWEPGLQIRRAATRRRRRRRYAGVCRALRRAESRSDVANCSRGRWLWGRNPIE